MTQAKPVDYITNLTALRGFAALFVLWLHAKDAIIYGLHLKLPLDIQLIAKGHLAVDLFFVLSGFVLTHVYGPKLQTVDKQTYWSFIQNRFARVYPVHFIVMAVLGLLKLGGKLALIPYVPILDGTGITSTFWTFITSVLMVQSWHLHTNWTWNVPAWSISSEWFVYLLAPFLILGFKHFQKPSQALGTFLLGTGALCWLHTAFPDSFLTYDFGNLRMLFEFIMGIGMYYLYAQFKEMGILTKNKNICDWLFVLITLAAVLTIQFSSLGNYYLINILIWIIPFAALSKGFISSFLSYKPFFYLGEISYSLYLVHLLFISMLTEPFRALLASGGIPAFFLFLLTCTFVGVVVAHFTYQYIEIPARDWIKKLSFFRKPRLRIAASPNN